jgi:hypothetical protein
MVIVEGHCTSRSAHVHGVHTNFIAKVNRVHMSDADKACDPLRNCFAVESQRPSAHDHDSKLVIRHRAVDVGTSRIFPRYLYI